METVAKSPFAVLKARILKLTKNSIINLQVAKDKAGIKIIATVDDCNAILAILQKPRRITPPVPAWVKDRYNEAHKTWFQSNYKQAYDAGHYTKPVFPKVNTSNGLTNFALNFIQWHGFRATRISASGRKLPGPNGDKWIKGTTRPGSADISATILSRSVMIEIKCGMDKPSDKQLKEQERERKAGGIYEFCRTAMDVINLFDQVVYGS